MNSRSIKPFVDALAPLTCKEWRSLLNYAAYCSFEEAVRRLLEGHYASAFVWVAQRGGDPTVRRCVKALVRHALDEIAKIDLSDSERREHKQWLTLIALSVGAIKPTRKTAEILGPACAYLCAADVIGGRWPEAEKTIAKEARYAYLYALNVIGGRWPEAEKTIAQDKWYAYHYEIDVIRGG